MGPRAVGFLLGAALMSGTGFLLLQYDVMKKHEATASRLDAVGDEVTSLVRRFNDVTSKAAAHQH